MYTHLVTVQGRRFERGSTTMKGAEQPTISIPPAPRVQERTQHDFCDAMDTAYP